MALEPDWRWCSEDYSSWDFDRADGMRLEVKQSAVKQSWATETAAPSIASFDIAHRKGRWEGALWIEEPGRHAQLYVFAHHFVGTSDADHRDPAQWAFYVVPTGALPMTKRIGIGAVRALADPCDFDGLRAAVESCASSIRGGR
jgi:hypothetical protein